MGKIRWSDLPIDLVECLAGRLTSNIDLIHIRSICKPWRSRVPAKKRVRNHFKRDLPVFKDQTTILSSTTYFRVTLPSSCPDKGWLTDNRQVSEVSKRKRLLSPMSCQHITRSPHKTLDLLKFGVSTIYEAYNVQYFTKNDQEDLRLLNGVFYRFFANADRVVFLDNLFFVVYINEIWWCKNDEGSRCWTRINNEEVDGFLDIILHRGKIYALDLSGAIWWISLSEFNIYKYRFSTPKEDLYNEDDINKCKEKRLVEYCGDLCIFHRFFNLERTVGFKVYKMDEDLVEWVEVSSLGRQDNHPSEYYGCLENAIYFSEAEDDSVFKLDDGSIITKKIGSSSSSSHQNCFEMFYTPFL
ncbi:hypothetical protein CARUB_v10011007mg [Capsella rubella]|uniref:KIB1-4 beta-propeller domain-containing protein n=1 Tax=Capsella rubella TaxID=81985 RepID=R0IHV0_9BRAS|nr:hypothetical protein CARUB_v10011007mg [Capsella rubella]